MTKDQYFGYLLELYQLFRARSNVNVSLWFCNKQHISCACSWNLVQGTRNNFEIFLFFASVSPHFEGENIFFAEDLVVYVYTVFRGG